VSGPVAVHEEADMSLMTLLVVLALAATVYSLIRGVSSMAVDKPVGQRSSVQWMFARVGFQALAVALLLAALLVGR
jgi:Zn-dependent protease